ncbi:33 kDa inner dynein arm light chain, axonemal-like [Paramacrobiotus metropolitanus]|uniref:33 kDa inner dynein arm light chain, axonemal-like n=1 Tax=Paramacrobiotus metropolitanus TaxID=2943436 RepID=UPI0024459A8C|nr:33 kDa inner dynein arm light chain, axonemal-like [Paramacrobiotus metropolitanus]XP_055356770.1 33 kDa inner dynein arm light chain, axonemal-like [Paramacrobiotus metropolitanus]XP_055356771.1 33 kDa inner dynein arm light chain, axonemal-like [Paramacrobiotus metropolitanus]XP_055356773.1 33 kDa inner dynein arm light chain, axonemal-like [Paramacrobiotus metropolitanus]
METTERYSGPAPSDHLLKYGHPTVITKRFAASPTKKGEKKDGSRNSIIKSEDYNIVLSVPPRPEKKPPKNLNIFDIRSADDILDYILPPRLWTENGLQYVQKVSRIPATRMDVLNLQERLDNRLEHLGARETGICPVRRELYTQAFDELIRQATLECAERGLMLLRVRDEIRMSIAAYQTLFESSMAYGMRKVLLSEQGKNECTAKITDYNSRNISLQRQVDEWKEKFDTLEKRNEEVRALDSQRKLEELEAVIRTNEQLATVLDNITVQRSLVLNTGSATDDLAAMEEVRAEKKKKDETADDSHMDKGKMNP